MRAGVLWDKIAKHEYIKDEPVESVKMKYIEHSNAMTSEALILLSKLKKG